MNRLLIIFAISQGLIVQLRAASTSTIVLVSLPATSAIVRHMHGDYAQHAAAAHALLDLAKKSCGDRGVLFGEYPDDPGVVGMANVNWTLGYELADNIPPKCVAKLSKPYDLEKLPIVRAAAVTTTLGEASRAGLGLLKWLPDSGYVQAGPTRMEYLGLADEAQTPVRILLPIKKRAWPPASH